jgi:hypothetical protein
MTRLTMAGTAVFAVALAAAHVLAQQAAGGAAPVDPPTGSNQSTILITTMAGLATLFFTQAFALWRESRNRKWDLEDRMAARREMRAHAETQRLETIQTAIDLAKVSNINRQQLTEHLTRNTEITQAAKDQAAAAYQAADNFNEKLETLRKQLAGAGGTLGTIEEASTDTNAKVTELRDKLVP